MSRIIIKNLPRYYDKEKLSTYLKSLPQLDAEITDVSVAKTKEGVSRRFAFIGFKNEEDADKAIRYLNKSYVETSRIEVHRALDYRSANEKLRPYSKYASKNIELKLQKKEKEEELRNLEEEKAKKKKDANLKRKFLDTLDPKAREFLKLSSSISNSRSWENEEVFDTEITNPVIPADEDDDEYQDLPAAKRHEGDSIKSSEHDSTLDSGVVIDGREKSSSELHEEESEQAAEGDTAKNSGTDAQAPLSDDEWLRLHRTRIKEKQPEEEVSDVGDELKSFDKENNDEHLERVTNDKIADASMPQKAEDNVSEQERNIQLISETKRLFLRNLTYSCAEDDLKSLFGPFGQLEQVHMPIDKKTNNPKGFAYVDFHDADDAVRAYLELDAKPFQGRLLHVLPAKARSSILLDDYALSKLPLKKQRELKRKNTAASSTFSWNSLYMNADAVVTSLASRLGVKKTDILDPTSSDSAVKQALTETHVIQETKNFFEEHGVDLDAFKNAARSDNVLLVKNFPYGTSAEELTSLFSPFGELGRILIPPAGTIAIIEFLNAPDCRQAFSKLAYTRIKSSILYLEKAPRDVFTTSFKQSGKPELAQKVNAVEATTSEKVGTEDIESLDTATIYVKNLNFSTKQEEFQKVFKPLEGYLSAVIRAKPDPKRPGKYLSMGFGFVEFKDKASAVAAMHAMNGFVLDGHKLEIKLSHQGVDAAAEVRKQDSSKPKGTKILIKNLPFEATKKDVQSLLGAYGQLRSVRVPKKFDRSARGFAFAEFVTAREAANAMRALKNTHLLGRHLVLQYASNATMDDMQHAIEKMAKEANAEAAAPSITGKRLIETD